jgi:hypothetical protein
MGGLVAAKLAMYMSKLEGSVLCQMVRGAYSTDVHITVLGPPMTSQVASGLGDVMVIAMSESGGDIPSTNASTVTIMTIDVKVISISSCEEGDEE